MTSLGINKFPQWQNLLSQYLGQQFSIELFKNIYILAARPAFGGPLASQGATPPGPPFDTMPVSWMKSAYYNRVDICLCTNTKILSLVQ